MDKEFDSLFDKGNRDNRREQKDITIAFDDEGDGDEEAEERRRVALLAELERLGALTCMSCGRVLCSHAYVICVASGFKTTPRCVACIAAGYERPVPEFLTDAVRYIRRHPCYWSGWQWANRHEGQARNLERPACLWSKGSPPETALGEEEAEPQPETELKPDVVWDAGDMSCGDLVLELRLRMKRLQAGQLLALTARDPGAPQDIPAWCRLTRHSLAAAAHPHYWIRRRRQS